MKLQIPRVQEYRKLTADDIAELYKQDEAEDQPGKRVKNTNITPKQTTATVPFPPNKLSLMERKGKYPLLVALFKTTAAIKIEGMQNALWRPVLQQPHLAVGDVHAIVDGVRTIGTGKELHMGAHVVFIFSSL